MLMPNPQFDALRGCVEDKPERVLFASACGPMLYGFPHQRRYVDLRGVHIAPGEAPACGAHAETREWRECRSELQIEWVSHEVGKFVRLLQMNNGSAYEQLFSPHTVLETPHLAELREIAHAMLSQQLVAHYRGLFQGQLRFFLRQPERQGRQLLYMFRAGLTGLHLLEHGHLCVDLPTLAHYHERASVLQLLRELSANAEVRNMRPYIRELHGLAARLEASANRGGLPEHVPHRERAEAWLVSLRRAQAEPGRPEAPAHRQ